MAKIYINRDGTVVVSTNIKNQVKAIPQQEPSVSIVKPPQVNAEDAVPVKKTGRVPSCLCGVCLKCKNRKWANDRYHRLKVSKKLITS